MGDNLGLSLGLQAVPKTYENIYMSNLKEKRAGEAAASKAKAEDEEALRKYEGDIKLDPALYHKSQESAVRGLASKYYAKIEKNRLERPLTWQNDMPQINNDFALESKKLQLQGKNINELYAIPVDERTTAQKEVISRLDNNQDISGYVDPTNSVSVTPDGYIDVSYRMNKNRANVQGEVNKKIKDYQGAFLSDSRTINILGNNYAKFARQGLPSTVADAEKLQKQYGLLDTPPSVEQVIGDAVVGDPDLVHHAMEAKRKDILDLHERAIKDNLTADEVSQQGNKIIYDYLLGFAHPGVTTSIQRVPQPSTGGGGGAGLQTVTFNTAVEKPFTHSVKRFQTNADGSIKYDPTTNQALLDENTPYSIEKLQMKTIPLSKKISMIATPSKVYNTSTGEWETVNGSFPIAFQEVLEVPFYTKMDRLATKDEIKAGKDIETKKVVSVGSGGEQKLYDFDTDIAPQLNIKQAAATQGGTAPTQTAAPKAAATVSISKYSKAQQDGIRAVMKNNNIDEQTAINALIKAGKLK